MTHQKKQLVEKQIKSIIHTHNIARNTVTNDELRDQFDDATVEILISFLSYQRQQLCVECESMLHNNVLNYCGNINCSRYGLATIMVKGEGFVPKKKKK